jgi:hypothetical protein
LTPRGSGRRWAATSLGGGTRARRAALRQWKRLVARAEHIELFGPVAMGCDAFWVAARELDELQWLEFVARAEQVDLVEEDAHKCRACWQLLCCATTDQWDTALTRITLVHQEAPEGVRADGVWLSLLKKRDDAHFATAMDRVRQTRKSKHSDGKSSALTSNSCWDQLSKMHDDETWATMFGVFLLFAKGAANQDLMWAVLDRNFTVAV